MRLRIFLVLILGLMLAGWLHAQRGLPIPNPWAVQVISNTDIPDQGLVTVIEVGYNKHFMLFNGVAIPLD
jgi:hypothetical protein